MAAALPRAALAVAWAAFLCVYPGLVRCADDEMLLGEELVFEVDEGFAGQEAGPDTSSEDAETKAAAAQPQPAPGTATEDGDRNDGASSPPSVYEIPKPGEDLAAHETGVPQAAVRREREEFSLASRGLIMVPAPEVLAGHLDFAVSLGSRHFISMPELAGAETASQGPNVKAGIGICRRVEIGIEAVSSVNKLDHLSGYMRALILEERGNRPALGLGVMDLTADPKPNADVAMPITELGGAYTDDDKANNSLYVVLAKRIPQIEGIPVAARGYMGMGRGRFVARYGAAENVHGAFWGGELDLSSLGFITSIQQVRNVRLLAEMDGRSLNAGMDLNFLPFGSAKTDAFISLQLAARHLQHLRPHRWDIGLRPALVGRMEVVMRGKSIAPGTVETITLSPPVEEAEIDISAPPAKKPAAEAAKVEPAPEETVTLEEEASPAPAQEATLEREETGVESALKAVKTQAIYVPEPKSFGEFIRAGIAVGEIPPAFDGEVLALTDPDSLNAKASEEVIVTGGYNEGSQFAVYDLAPGSCAAVYLGNIRVLKPVDEISSRAVIETSLRPITKGHKLVLLDSVRNEFGRQREAAGDERAIRGQIGCLPDGRRWISTGEAVMQIDVGARDGVLYGQVFELIVPGGVGKRSRARVIRVDEEASFLKLLKLYQPVGVGDWMRSVPVADNAGPPKP